MDGKRTAVTIAPPISPIVPVQLLRTRGRGGDQPFGISEGLALATVGRHACRRTADAGPDREAHARLVRGAACELIERS